METDEIPPQAFGKQYTHSKMMLKWTKKPFKTNEYFNITTTEKKNVILDFIFLYNNLFFWL